MMYEKTIDNALFSRRRSVYIPFVGNIRCPYIDSRNENIEIGSQEWRNVLSKLIGQAHNKSTIELFFRESALEIENNYGICLLDNQSKSAKNWKVYADKIRLKLLDPSVILNFINSIPNNSNHTQLDSLRKLYKDIISSIKSKDPDAFVLTKGSKDNYKKYDLEWNNHVYPDFLRHWNVTKKVKTWVNGKYIEREELRPEIGKYPKHLVSPSWIPQEYLDEIESDINILPISVIDNKLYKSIVSKIIESNGDKILVEEVGNDKTEIEKQISIEKFNWNSNLDRKLDFEDLNVPFYKIMLEYNFYELLDAYYIALRTKAPESMNFKNCKQKNIDNYQNIYTVIYEGYRSPTIECPLNILRHMLIMEYSAKDLGSNPEDCANIFLNNIWNNFKLSDRFKRKYALDSEMPIIFKEFFLRLYHGNDTRDCYYSQDGEIKKKPRIFGRVHSLPIWDYEIHREELKNHILDNDINKVLLDFMKKENIKFTNKERKQLGLL